MGGAVTYKTPAIDLEIACLVKERHRLRLMECKGSRRELYKW